MVSIVSKGTIIHCATCQYWTGERKPGRMIPLSAETPAVSTKGICTNPKQFQYKGKETEAQFCNCHHYQHWDQLKQ
ncbi:MAG: hypothetical protein IJH82_06835 [Lachnospiraceae bacterium]|nr:hypothetical protein [Lachnospiraceae bacterium]